MYAQVKRWAAERPGWAITGVSLASSNFAAAPTGASTITRFLSPRVGEEHHSVCLQCCAHSWPGCSRTYTNSTSRK